MRWSKVYAVALFLVCLMLLSFMTPFALAAESTSTPSGNAAESEVVTLGANLSAAQQDKMFDIFSVDKNDSKIKVIKVTNQEERQYLKGLVPDQQIGTRAISCVYVKILEDGSGVNVKTKNITFVTDQAYANALITVKIEDAQVYAAAPFPVSGTAALTGLFKAYEEATGEQIPEEAKKVATEELVTTSEIGEETGEKKGVSELVSRVKEKVVEEGLENPEEIRQVVEEVAKDMDISLSSEQIDKIVALMEKISKLDLDINTLQTQLEGIRSKLKGLFGGEQYDSTWDKIVDFFVNLWNKVKGLFQ